MKIHKYITLITSLFLCFCSCSAEVLKVHSDYLSHESLASYHVGTPDPQLRCPPIGQRLVISWFLPDRYKIYSDIQLHLRIRYYNHQEEEFYIPVKKRKDDYLFCLINEEYRETGGIATYKITLEGDGECLQEWRHALWAEWIALDCKKKNSKKEKKLPYSLEELDTEF